MSGCKAILDPHNKKTEANFVADDVSGVLVPVSTHQILVGDYVFDDVSGVLISTTKRIKRD
ncbi:MAG: hypothetical protein WAP55_02260 [Minisyncoccia bacterium]